MIAELQIERASHRGTVGNVVLGKVTRVLPGMQAAFIDVGQERSAFLHVEDLIRPDDFEHYLAGGADEQDESFRGAGGRKAAVRDEEDDEEDESEADEVPVPVRVDGSERLNGLRPEVGDEVESDAEDGRSEDEAVDDAGGDEDADDDEALDEGALDDAVLDEGALDEGGADEGGLDEASLDEAGSDDAEDLDDSDVEDIDDSEVDESEADEDDDADDDDIEALDLPAYTVGSGPLVEPGTERVRTRSRARPEPEPAAASPEAAGTERIRVERVSFQSDRSEDGRSEVVRLDTTVVEASRDAVDGAVVPRQRVRAGRSEGGRPEGGRSEGGRGERPEVARVDSGLPDPPVRGRGGSRQRGRGGPQGARGRRGRQRGNASGGGNAAAPAANANTGGNNGANSSKLVRGRRAVRGKTGGGGRTSEGAAPPRVTRSVPITEVVSEGDQVVVQISKEPIGTKGARVTSHVSLPGRYVVYLPTVDHLGISKRIGSARERARLRQVMESLKPARGGLIVRTVAEGLTKKQLKADVGYLIRVWAEVCKRRETARPAEVLYTELDLVLKVARDLFTDEVKTIVIDDREQYARLVRFVEMFLPERVKDIELYAGSEPIFDAYGIEDEIGRALSRKVPLPSGGSLIVDQAEALTAIDVNTGRYVGKGSKDLEETALKTNLEAVEEIAYQLRFRNIGGLVILDLIDMEKYSNREKVWRALEQALVKDKAKTTLNRISELGLIEMTRKRTRESLGRMLHEPCFYCDGTGQIQSKATIAYEILRQIGRERYSLPGYSVVVNAHPSIVDFLKTEDRAALDEAERRYARRIELAQRTEYHIEQYDLQGK